jgi:DNA adenine methylase
MKPPFRYYGGKQRMARRIVDLMPRHTVYVEPFCGSAAVFFAKPVPLVTNRDHYREVINDHDSRIVNFFQVLRDQPGELERLCSLTPYSREEHRLCKADEGSPLERARRYWLGANSSFGATLGRGWQTGVATQNHAGTLARRIPHMRDVTERLRGVYIEHLDALELIRKWDSPQTLFYCDPPYPEAHQGHYSGYTSEDFARLVDTLDQCQGSFLLSNYDQPGVPEHWERHEFSAHASSNGKGCVGAGRDKTRAAVTPKNKRTEVVWRRLATVEPRPELVKAMQRPEFDCFGKG